MRGRGRLRLTDAGNKVGGGWRERKIAWVCNVEEMMGLLGMIAHAGSRGNAGEQVQDHSQKEDDSKNAFCEGK